MPAPAQPPLVLASTSRYRRELLQRLGLAFACDAPGVDEAPRPGEAPADMARRLADDKANAVAARYAGAIVVGSDQVAELDGEALGKPGDHAGAVRQLRACSGRRVAFHTAACVIDTRDASRHVLLDLTEVWFRRLADAEIERYLAVDSPYDCAGSFKAEALGVSLFERLRSDDPTALIGLPLIGLAAVLRGCGLSVP